MTRAGRALLALAWLACLETRVAAAQPDGLSRCMERALSPAKAAGAKVFQRGRDAFLIAPDSSHHEFVLPADGCMGFLVVGRRHTQALDLTLYRNDGRIIAQQEQPGVFGYLRACGAQGEHVIADIRMRDGSGVVRMMPLWHAPAQVPGLALAMAECRDVGMTRPELVDVGPEPLSPPLRASIGRLSESLSVYGYQPLGEPLRGQLPTMRRDIRRIALTGGRCYAIAAIGDGDVGDIDLRVFGPEEAPRLLASEMARSNRALVKLCAERDDNFLLDVRMYEGGGAYLVQGYELPLPDTPIPPGTAGTSLIGLKEVEALLSARGLSVRDTLWLVLPARGEQRVPVQLDADTCYGFALIPSSDPRREDLDVSVTDSDGNLLSAEVGPGDQPVAYLCTQAGGAHAVIAHTPGATRATRTLLVIAGDRPSEPAR